MSNNQMVTVPRELVEFAVGFKRNGHKNLTDQRNDQANAQDKLRTLLDKPVEQHQVAPELTDDLREILGRPNFTCHFITKALRVMAHSIAHKSEDEQAVVIHWLLDIYLKHGPDWRQRAAAELEEASQSFKT